MPAGDESERTQDRYASNALNICRAVRHFSSSTGVKQDVTRLRRVLWLAVRIATVSVIAAAAMIFSSYLFGEWYASRTEAAQRDVWAAYLNEEIRSQGTEFRDQPLPEPQIVVQNHTQREYRHVVLALVWPAALLSKQRPISRLPALQATTYIRYLLGNLRSHPVRQNLALSAQYRLANAGAVATYGQDWARWKTLFPGSSGYFELSTVGFNSDQTQALLHVDHVCGLCGHGGYVLLRKVNGRWAVAAEVSSWVS